MRFGIRLHVIVRETEEEAWRDAETLISRVDEATIARAQQVFARMDSHGQSRMKALHNGSRESLEISPNLWAGVGLVRGGAGTALVGDADTVAERMREYEELGIDTFIFSGYPHLEEAYRFAELVFPKLGVAAAAGHARESAPRRSAPFGGEIIASAERPRSRRAASGWRGSGMTTATSRSRPRCARSMPWLVPALILVVWQVLSMAGLIAARVLPAPTEVARAGWRVAHRGHAAQGRGHQRPARPARLPDRRRRSGSRSGWSTDSSPGARGCWTAACRWRATSRTWR